MKNLKLLLFMLICLVFLVGCSGDNNAEDKKPKGEVNEEKVEVNMAADKFEIVTTAFKDGEKIPTKYANTSVSGGQNVSLPLEWNNPPEGTKSFALLIVDRHPVASNWIHWLAINIPASESSLSEGASGVKMPEGAIELPNTPGNKKYEGPEPPPGTGDHDYETIIYALNADKLDLQTSKKYSIDEFEKSIQGKALASARITGKFSQ